MPTSHRVFSNYYIILLYGGIFDLSNKIIKYQSLAITSSIIVMFRFLSIPSTDTLYITSPIHFVLQ